MRLRPDGGGRAGGRASLLRHLLPRPGFLPEHRDRDCEVLELGAPSWPASVAWAEALPLARVTRVEHEAVPRGARGGPAAQWLALGARHAPAAIIDNALAAADRGLALALLYPVLLPGGFYILEDDDVPPPPAAGEQDRLAAMDHLAGLIEAAVVAGMFGPEQAAGAVAHLRATATHAWFRRGGIVIRKSRALAASRSPARLTILPLAQAVPETRRFDNGGA